MGLTITQMLNTTHYSKSILLFLFISFFTFSFDQPKKINDESDKKISLEYPEPYELANIILALTEYGKTDKWEVRKSFDYYKKVLAYFNPVNDHPLLDSVNYSREKWEEYLSFRTDAFAFEFDKDDKLIRRFEFYTVKGIQPFDDHLELINDFIQKSEFRAFFKSNLNYYKSLSEKYEKTQYINEMSDFLKIEFGEQFSNETTYKVVLSPLVYRMNCHRNIDTTTVADFITIPDYILTDTIAVSEKNIASSIHLLFTEMDHGYVNPTTKQYKELVTKSFDSELWDDKSGYDEYDFAVFNEYMTWAVYDIFLSKYFPAYAREVGLTWSFQNESRGFKYSYLFTQQLLSLYNLKDEDETLKDLYPKMLNRISIIQKDLSKPEINSPIDSLTLPFEKKSNILIRFSEPMIESDTLSMIFHYGKGLSKFINLHHTENNLRWKEKGVAVEFDFDLSNVESPCFFQFNSLGVLHPLISKKGVLLKKGDYFKVIHAINR